jgi:hypothetical protein
LVTAEAQTDRLVLVMPAKVTRETLAHDRERRERERQALARKYRDAAYALERQDAAYYYSAVRLLRDEAERWER